MARRVALIPEELISSHHYQNPELRLEDEIGSLLDRKKIPDDMKAKLLSQLVMRYQKTFHTPPEPIPVTVQNNEISENEKKQKRSDENSVKEDDSYEKQEIKKQKQSDENSAKEDSIMNNILISVPPRFQKFVPMIAEKLKTRNYFWNSNEEMMVGKFPIKGSNVVDFFAYLFRNTKNQSEPYNFDLFLKALSEINIPSSWIANKDVLTKLKGRNADNASSSYNPSKVSSFMKQEFELGKHRREPENYYSKKWERARSQSPKRKKWLQF